MSLKIKVKKWDFASDAEGFVGAGTGTPSWSAIVGDGDGGFSARCSSAGGGCSFQGVPTDPFDSLGIYLNGFTWAAVLGIPTGAIITKILATDGTNTTHARGKKSSTAGNGFLENMWIYDKNGNNIYFDVAGTLTTSFADYTALADSGDLLIPATDLFTISMGYSGSINAGSVGTQTVSLDEIQIVVQYRVVVKDIISLGTVIPFLR